MKEEQIIPITKEPPKNNENIQKEEYPNPPKKEETIKLPTWSIEPPLEIKRNES